MSVQENSTKVREMETAVREHCMAARFGYSDGRYTVIYPAGYWPHGARVSARDGKANALGLLLNVMERHWNEGRP